MCFTDRHDMTFAVKVAFNTNTTNKPATCMPQVISKHIEHYGIISCTETADSEKIPHCYTVSKVPPFAEQAHCSTSDQLL